jgi:hypothetical protein
VYHRCLEVAKRQQIDRGQPNLISEATIALSPRRLLVVKTPFVIWVTKLNSQAVRRAPDGALGCPTHSIEQVFSDNHQLIGSKRCENFTPARVSHVLVGFLVISKLENIFT